MFKWFQRRTRLDDVEKCLQKLQTIPVKFSKKHERCLKIKIMTRLEESIAHQTLDFEDLALELQKLTLHVEPTSSFKLKTRSHVLDSLNLRFQRLNVAELWKGFVFRRRFFAGIMAFSLLFFGTLGFSQRFPGVEASKKITQLDEAQGAVYGLKDGQVQSLYPSDVLEGYEKIWTEEGGTSSILFMDDTYLTLGPDTEIEFLRLWSDEYQAVTSIELRLIRGRAWVSVSNLVGNSDFVISTADSRFSADDKVAFDVAAFEDRTVLRVFDYLVDFHVEHHGIQRDGTLGPLLRLTIDDDLMIDSFEEQYPQLLMEDVWVQTNLNQQNHFQDRLALYYQNLLVDQAGVLPGDVLHLFERGADSLGLWLNFDDETRLEFSLALIQKRFSEALTLIRQGELEAAKVSLDAYQGLFVTVSNDFGSNAQIKILLDDHRKIISGLSTQVDLEPIRSVIDETVSMMNLDQKSIDYLQFESAVDRLQLAFDFVEIGAYSLAESALNDYRIQMQSVIQKLSELDRDSREALAHTILSRKTRDLQILKLIEGLLDSGVEVERVLLNEVDRVRTETLFELNILILSLKERSLMQLTVFLQDVKADPVIQRQILNRLKKTVPLSFELIQKINDVEAFYDYEGTEVIVLDEQLMTLKSVESLPFEDYQEDAVESQGVPGEAEVGSD